MKLIVRIRQTLEKEFHVEAKSHDEAKKIAEAKLASGEFRIGLEDQCDMSSYVMQDDCVEDGGDLVQSYFDIGSTVSLMDKFESRNVDKTKKYRRLILKHFTVLEKCRGTHVWASLIVERIDYGVKTEGDVTMSQLKGNGSYEVSHYIDTCIQQQCGGQFPTAGTELMFKTPYRLRAQTSYDRMPGGWEYGTKYGDTHEYGIVGVKFSR